MTIDQEINNDYEEGQSRLETYNYYMKLMNDFPTQAKPLLLFNKSEGSEAGLGRLKNIYVRIIYKS